MKQQVKFKKQHIKYPEYKDSVMGWGQEIPSEWNVYKLKHICQFQSGDGFPDEFQGAEEGEIPFFKVSDINGEGKNVIEASNYVSKLSISENSWHLVPERSILLAKIGAALAKNHRKVNGVECCIDNNMLAVSSKQPLESGYLYWIWQNIDATDFQNISSVPSINMNMLRNQPYPLPKKDEQDKMASYLDQKATLLDKIIEKKKMQIELLKEKRAAVINQAVTKGLDPDVEMVDSGVEWIGKVPKGWRLEKLKYLAKLRVDKVQGQTDKKRYIALENIESFTGRLLESKIELEPESQVNQFYAGDVLFNKLRPYLAKAFVAEYEGISTGELLVLQSKKGKVLPRFLFFRLLSDSFLSLIDNSTYGTKMPRASWEFIGNTFVAAPDVGAQVEICDLVEAELSKIDALRNMMDCSIKLLTEYKTSLISHVVTGKVRV